MNFFEAQREAAKRLSRWMDEAVALRAFYIAKKLPVPPILEETVGTDASQAELTAPEAARLDMSKPSTRGRRAEEYTYTLPASPDYGVLPAGAGEDWIAVPVLQAGPYNLVKALLVLHDGESSAFLNSKLGDLRGFESNSGYNALKKLDQEGVISGNTQGWRVIKEIKARIQGNRLWVPERDSSDTDKAAVRREVIMAALKVNPALTMTGVMKCLQDCKWLKTTVNADLIKADLREMLRQRKLLQSESKEWSLNPRYEKEGR